MVPEDLAGISRGCAKPGVGEAKSLEDSVEGPARKKRSTAQLRSWGMHLPSRNSYVCADSMYLVKNRSHIEPFVLWFLKEED